MKNYTFLSLFVFVLCSCTYNSKPAYNGYSKENYTSKYESVLKPSEKQLQATYNTMKSFDSQSDKYIKRVFIPEDKMLISYAEYSDAGFNVLEGMQRIYYPNGNLSKETPYINDLKYGVGYEYYRLAKNATRSKGKYEEDVRHGEWESFNEDGRSTALYTYIEGDRHGPYAIYGENGATKEEGMYIRGKLKNNKKLSEGTAEAIDKVYKVVKQMPQFPGCENEQDSLERHKCQQMEMLKFIYSNLRYPAIDRERGMEGTTIIQFVVDKSGVLKDIEGIRVVTRAMEKAAIDVIKKMPKWYPGIQNDEAVDVLFTLPLKFKLE